MYNPNLWYNIDMKICTKCKKDKEPQDFPVRSSSKDGRASACKRCAAEYAKKSYQEGDKERKSKNQRKTFQRNIGMLKEYLSGKECKECKEKDIEVFEFDHTDPKEKKHNVSEMVWHYSWKKILQEIEKCQILCANCHRRKTNRQFGHWRTTSQ